MFAGGVYLLPVPNTSGHNNATTYHHGLRDHVRLLWGVLGAEASST